MNKVVDSIDFEKGNGLVPAIIQDCETNEVLMMAYMNKESFERTMDGDTTWFYSRSRNKLWNKGSTSGHVQQVKEMYIDCDNDTVLIKVKQKGVACHTGKYSCFYKKVR